MAKFPESLEKTLYRVREAALILNISTKSVYRLYAKGILQGVKFKRSVRILGGSILEFKQAKNK